MAWNACALKALKENKFKAQGLSNVLYRHALLGVSLSPDLQAAWETCALNALKTNKFNEQQLSNIFYAYALSNQNIPEQYIKPILNILNISIDEQIQFSIYRGLNYFGLLERLTPVLKKKYEIFVQQMKAQKNRTSHLEQNIGIVLKKIFPREIEKDYWFEPLICHVDFYLPKYKTVIEVDGPSHFIGRTQNTATSLRNKILEQQDINVVSIPYFEWDDLKEEEKMSYLHQKVNLKSFQNLDKEE